MFSVIDAVLLRPFPYPKPDRLIQYYLTDQGKENAIDYPDYLDISAAQHSCESLAFVCSGILDLTGEGPAQRLNTDFVSASMFKVSELPPRASIDRIAYACIDACMATKTISVDLEAYERLVRARKHSHESFSQVIKRARWEESSHSGAALLAALERLKPLDRAVIHELEAAQKQDKPPHDKWRILRATRRS
jgi:hypothetical protein